MRKVLSAISYLSRDIEFIPYPHLLKSKRCHSHIGMAFTLFGFFILTMISSCKTNEAQSIVDASIAYHGSAALRSGKMEFVFREKSYTSTRSGGEFIYTRTFEDSTGLVEDVYTNTSFSRKINGQVIPIIDEQKLKFSNSINSVIYFASLPEGLNDKAVVKKYIGQDTIENKVYHCVEISFTQEGGGQDHDDVFYYWFDAEDKSLDYFAYLYHTDGGGIRFRKAINTRKIGEIYIQDYINYKPANDIEKSVELNQILDLYKASKLEVLSEIITEEFRFVK